MKSLSEKEKAVLAMAIDCEGHISLSLHEKTKRNSFTCSVVVRIMNTNIDLLHHIQSMTRIGVVDPQTKIPKRKLQYIWRLRTHEMEDFLEAIKNDLVIKRDQCVIALEYLTRDWQNPLSEDDLQFRRVAFSEMQELNQKGD
jgi:hypothetical protein